MEPPTVSTQTPVAPQGVNEKAGKATETNELEELDTLFRDTRLDSFEKRIPGKETTILGYSAKDLNSDDSIVALLLARRLAVPAGEKLAQLGGFVLDKAGKAGKWVKGKGGWLKSNKLKAGGAAVDVAFALYYADKHFGYKWNPFLEGEVTEESIKTYNDRLLYDTSKKNELTETYKFSDDVEVTKGSEPETKEFAQAEIYQFEGGAIYKRSGNAIEVKGKDDAQIQELAWKDAMEAERENVDPDKLVETLSREIRSLTKTVRQLSEDQLKKDVVKSGLTKLGKRINIKLDFLKKVVDSQSGNLKEASLSDLKTALRLLESEKALVKGVDKDLLENLMKISSDSSSTTTTESPELEFDDSPTKKKLEDIKLKSFDNLSKTEQEELETLSKKLQGRYDTVQAYLTKQMKANSASVKAFAPDGKITEDNYNRIIDMMKSDLLSGEDYSDTELGLSDKEKEKFEKFLQSGDAKDLSLPAVLTKLKDLNKATPEAGTPLESNVSPAKAEEIEEKLTSIYYGLKKSKELRESDLMKLSTWLKDNFDNATVQDLLAKLDSNEDIDMDLANEVIPNPFTIKKGRNNEEITIANLKSLLLEFQTKLKE